MQEVADFQLLLLLHSLFYELKDTEILTGWCISVLVYSTIDLGRHY